MIIVIILNFIELECFKCLIISLFNQQSTSARANHPMYITISYINNQHSNNWNPRLFRFSRGPSALDRHFFGSRFAGSAEYVTQQVLAPSTRNPRLPGGCKAVDILGRVHLSI